MAKMQKKMRKNVNRMSPGGLLGDRPTERPMSTPQTQGKPQAGGSGGVPQNTLPGKPPALSGKDNDQIQAVTAMAMSVIYEEKCGLEKNLLPDALKRANQTVDHPEDAGPLAIADVSLWVIEEIEKKAESKKKSIRPVIAAGTMGAIVAQVAEVAQVSGIKLAEEDIQVGIAVAINKYISVAKKEGRVSNQELIEAANALQKEYPEELQDFNQMIQQRQKRHQEDPQKNQGAEQPQPEPEQQPVEQQIAGPPGGLLQNQPEQGGSQ